MSGSLYAWDGPAGLAQVGHLIQGARKTQKDVWEIIEMRHPPVGQQVPNGHTLWWRVANPFTGEEAFVPPRTLRYKVTYLVTEEELPECERSKTPPPREITVPSDGAEILLLAEELGAQEIARLDKETGRVTCPNYFQRQHASPWSPGILQIEELEHLRVAHGMDTSGLEEIDDPDQRTAATVAAHARAHNPQHPAIGKAGFPHYHD